MQGAYSPHRSWVRRGWRRVATAVPALLLAVALLPTTTGVASATQTFTFEGGGYGHSVGLSQFGAYGMALDGYSWQEILTHYYTDTTIQDVDPAVVADPLWVNLAIEQDNIELTTIGTGSGDPQAVTYKIGGRRIRAFNGQTSTIKRLADGRCRIITPQGTRTGPCTIDAEWDGWESSPSTAVELGGCTLPNWNLPTGVAYQPCTYARGSVRIRPDDNSNTFNLSIEIDIEDYLLGISESPYFWGSSGGMEALRAQAVAARTYALRKAYDRGDPEDRPWCACDLYDTTVDQFYVGWGHATPEWLEAVTSTAGKVVTHPSTVLDGVQRPIEAFYSSSTFGWTENSENGFSAYIPYLRGVDDHWSQMAEVGNHSARWTVQFSGNELATSLPGMNTVTGVEVASCSPSGAILELTFRGSGGPRTFRTSELRTRLGLKSMQVYNVGSPPSDEYPCAGPGTNPLPTGGPVVAAAVRIDDDSEGDSVGDGDGIIEPGERVEVFVSLTNEGDALTGVNASATSTSEGLQILWNTDSSYPALGAGATAENEADWDIAVSDDAAGALSIRLEVSAANGGPWTIDVPIGVIGAPASPNPNSIIGLPDVGGSPAPDLAVVYRSPGQAEHVLVIDSATGEIIHDFSAAKDRNIAAITLAPDIGGTDAPDLAMLIVSSTGSAIVRVVDAASGRRVARQTLSGRRMSDWSDLEILDGAAPGGGAAASVLGTTRSGRPRVVTKVLSGRTRLSNLVFPRGLDPIDLETFSDTTHDGVDEIATLTVSPTGASRVWLRDAVNVGLLGKIRLSAGLHGIRLVDGSTAAGPMLYAIASTAEGTTVVATIDPATRANEGEAEYPIWNATDARLVPGAGEAGNLLAILGSLSDGTPAVLLVDPATGNVVSAPQFPSTAVTGITPLGDGSAETLIAGLTNTGGVVTIQLRAALSGSDAGSIPLG